MTDEELVEQLADKEHASWTRWMAYVFQCAQCEFRADGTTALVLPTVQVNGWRRQVRTEYDDLTDKDKQYDRDEVAHILPIIHNYCNVTRAGAERLRAREAAMREIVQAVAKEDALWYDEYAKHCAFCDNALDPRIRDRIYHADDCPVTKARTILAAEDAQEQETGQE